MMAEKNDRNRIANFSKRALSLRSGLVYGLFALLLAVALTGGMTSAWFTSGDNTENTFTTGTLDIDATGPETATKLISGDCTQLNYSITNTGSKRSYVRARFEGMWRRSYHRNTAKAKVLYNNEWITATDSAYYSYGNFVYDPYTDPGSNPDPVGFTDEIALPPIVFPSLSLNNAMSDYSASYLQEDANLILTAVTSGYPDPCTGPLVVPVLGSAYPEYFPDGNTQRDPIAGTLPKPGSCTQLQSFKIDRDQSAIVDGKTYKLGDDHVESSDPNSKFEVTIYKSNGNVYFAFNSNYPVYHVYAKGGSDGGYFYMYYPTFVDGVYSDCGLSQHGGGWSHITFFYCVPPEDPSLTFKKFVSVDDGINWYDANTLLEAPVVDPDIAPQFKFVVENTGNVILTNIYVVDDYFGSINPISSLAPDAAWEFIVIDDNWKENQVLSTENISIKLCNNMTNWLPQGPQLLGTFFYYNQVVVSGETVPLCILVCLDADKTGNEYDGAVFSLYAFFDAVQASNNLIDLNWPGHPVNGN